MGCSNVPVPEAARLAAGSPFTTCGTFRACRAECGRLRRGSVSRLSTMNDILNEAVSYLDGRDDVDAIGHVLDSKPKAVQEL